MKGLELSREFYRQAVKPLLEEVVSPENYSAGLLGWSSEVLGFDDEYSRDHNWGPRVLIFLQNSLLESLSHELNALCSSRLPSSFMGFPTHFAPSALGDQPAMTSNASGPINHFIQFYGIETYAKQFLEWNYPQELKTEDWLRLDEHKLLGVTSGEVFHDGLNLLIPFRYALSFYPDNVQLRLLAKYWQEIAEEEAFPGRCNAMNDDIGAGIITARLIEKLIHICFLLEKRYSPYSKWLGKAFADLQCAKTLNPLFSIALFSKNSEEREKALGDSYVIVADLMNASGLIPPQPIKLSKPYSTRPGLCIKAALFAEACKSVL